MKLLVNSLILSIDHLVVGTYFIVHNDVEKLQSLPKTKTTYSFELLEKHDNESVKYTSNMHMLVFISLHWKCKTNK